MSLGEAAAEGDCCDSFEVAVESWPSGIWVTDSNTEKRRKEKPLKFRRAENLMTSRGYLGEDRLARARDSLVSSPNQKCFEVRTSSRQKIDDDSGSADSGEKRFKFSDLMFTAARICSLHSTAAGIGFKYQIGTDIYLACCV